MSNVVRRGRSRWFGHVEHKNNGDWFKACKDLVVQGIKRKRSGCTAWRECVGYKMTCRSRSYSCYGNIY